MISSNLQKAGRFAAMGLAGTGAIMGGSEMIREVQLHKFRDVPTVLKVGVVFYGIIGGAAFSPVYVPLRTYQLRNP